MNEPGKQPSPSVRDAYLEWAIATKFRFVQSERFGPFNDGSIGLLIQWLSPVHAKRGGLIARQANILVPGVYDGSRAAGGRKIFR